MRGSSLTGCCDIGAHHIAAACNFRLPIAGLGDVFPDHTTTGGTMDHSNPGIIDRFDQGHMKDPALPRKVDEITGLDVGDLYGIAHPGLCAGLMRQLDVVLAEDKTGKSGAIKAGLG